MSKKVVLTPGDLCLCAKGELGLITSETPRVAEINGKEVEIWTGVKPDGAPWESQTPKRLCHIEALIQQAAVHKIKRRRAK